MMDLQKERKIQETIRILNRDMVIVILSEVSEKPRTTKELTALLVTSESLVNVYIQDLYGLGMISKVWEKNLKGFHHYVYSINTEGCNKIKQEINEYFDWLVRA